MFSGGHDWNEDPEPRGRFWWVWLLPVLLCIAGLLVYAILTITGQT